MSDWIENLIADCQRESQSAQASAAATVQLWNATFALLQTTVLRFNFLYPHPPDGFAVVIQLPPMMPGPSGPELSTVLVTHPTAGALTIAFDVASSQVVVTHSGGRMVPASTRAFRCGFHGGAAAILQRSAREDLSTFPATAADLSRVLLEPIFRMAIADGAAAQASPAAPGNVRISHT